MYYKEDKRLEKVVSTTISAEDLRKFEEFCKRLNTTKAKYLRTAILNTIKDIK